MITRKRDNCGKSLSNLKSLKLGGLPVEGAKLLLKILRRRSRLVFVVFFFGGGIIFIEKCKGFFLGHDDTPKFPNWPTQGCSTFLRVNTKKFLPKPSEQHDTPPEV